jgi:hypothetical protein
VTVLFLRANQTPMEFLDFVEKYKLVLEIRETTTPCTECKADKSRFRASLVGCALARGWCCPLDSLEDSADAAVSALASYVSTQHILLPRFRGVLPEHHQLLVAPLLTHTRKIADVATITDTLI